MPRFKPWGILVGVAVIAVSLVFWPVIPIACLALLVHYTVQEFGRELEIDWFLTGIPLALTSWGILITPKIARAVGGEAGVGEMVTFDLFAVLVMGVAGLITFVRLFWRRNPVLWLALILNILCMYIITNDFFGVRI